MRMSLLAGAAVGGVAIRGVPLAVEVEVDADAVEEIGGPQRLRGRLSLGRRHRERDRRGGEENGAHLQLPSKEECCVNEHTSVLSEK